MGARLRNARRDAKLVAVCAKVNGIQQIYEKEKERDKKRDSVYKTVRLLQ